jgi:hypothetical protein
VLGSVNLEGVALATGAAYLRMADDDAIAGRPSPGRAASPPRAGRWWWT